ncbi:MULTISPECIES: energy transducer TonB [unclassified Ruegeria]|uniref:energy transducer TonB family protein n=1 Tax=unclassified Ruegeria TaxID=2625375 RepID=UPI001489DD7D|nr:MULTISPECIES: energy transducer TonB [unclassified Ruegeria]
MIRGSVVIAAVAILLSLFIHVMGLTFTAPRLSEQPTNESPADSVALGNTFEDLAEVIAEPVEPEPPEAPEPPVEAPEEPPEVPVSEALVASDNPQVTPSPDLGDAEVVQPIATEPVEPDVAETENTSEGDDAASQEVDETPPVEPSEVVETPEGAPDAVATQVEPVEPEPQQLAALPSPEVAPVLEVSPVPVVPLENEAVEPDLPTPAESPDDTDETSDLAVTSSIRPQRPERTPAPQRQGVQGGARDFSALRFPSQEVESPLTTYRRRGIDAFTSGNTGSRSGGREPGNSNTTNYAGRVLVHLNRAPVVFVSARGFAQVFFQINPDGSLAWVDVVDSSGSPEVDRAARAQVRAASPFPPPPGGVSRKLSFFYTSN